MTVYKHKKFNTLDDLTRFLNNKDIEPFRIVFAGIEHSAMNGCSSFGLIYLDDEED